MFSRAIHQQRTLPVECAEDRSLGAYLARLGGKCRKLVDRQPAGRISYDDAAETRDRLAVWGDLRVGPFRSREMVPSALCGLPQHLRQAYLWQLRVSIVSGDRVFDVLAPGVRLFLPLPDPIGYRRCFREREDAHAAPPPRVEPSPPTSRREPPPGQSRRAPRLRCRPRRRRPSTARSRTGFS